MECHFQLKRESTVRVYHAGSIALRKFSVYLSKPALNNIHTNARWSAIRYDTGIRFGHAKEKTLSQKVKLI